MPTYGHVALVAGRGNKRYGLAQYDVKEPVGGEKNKHYLPSLKKRAFTGANNNFSVFFFEGKLVRRG